MTERFSTAADFRQSLETRLRRRAAKLERPLERERQLVVFERYLARLMVEADDVVIKGGLAIELQTSRARTTKHVDLRVMGNPRHFVEIARDAGRRDAGDFLTFRVDPHPQHPEINAAGMSYEGHRYRVQAELAGKVYGNPFSVDVAFGEPMHGVAEVLPGKADLSFAGVELPALRVYPRSTHLAEKLGERRSCRELARHEDERADAVQSARAGSHVRA